VLSLKGIEGFSSPVVVEMQDWDNKDLVEMIASDIAEVSSTFFSQKRTYQ